MAEISSKSSLAVVLSKLKGFEKPKVREEQYTTEPEIAAELLWNMHMRGELDGKTIADLGSGTGFLGLGALLMGAKRVILVEKDKEAVKTAKQNLEFLKSQGFELGESVFKEMDVEEFSEIGGRADFVVENPPFGTRQEHIDKAFLKAAFAIADTVLSFHKTSTEKFVIAFAKDNGFRAAEKLDFKFPLHATQDYHTRKLHRIDVTLYRLEKED